MKFRLLMAALGVMLFAAACGPAPEIRSDTFLRDQSLISQDPCGPPCWRGITPGETTWGDAVTIVEDDPTLTEIQIRSDDETGQIGMAWAQVDGDGCCQMFTEDGERVDFFVAQVAPDLTLDQLLNTHGEPDYLLGELLPNDPQQGIFYLYYVDIPMLVYVFIAGEEGELDGTNEIVGFAYMTDDLMSFLVETANLYTWRGYQSYSEIMGAEFDVTPAVTLTPAN